MPRYIDADVAIYKIVTNKNFINGDKYPHDCCCDIIEAIPTADVVEVVRCKDCRYFKKIAERSDSGLCHRDIVASAWKDNGYCSRGKRKGGADMRGKE